MHKRSMSEPLMEGYQTFHGYDGLITERVKIAQGSSVKALANHGRPASISHAPKERVERAPHLGYGLPGLLDGFKSSARVAQMPSANGHAEKMSPVPTTLVSAITYPQTAYPSSDTNKDAIQPSHLSERRLSSASSSGMPFAVSMGPPCNPDLLTPFAATMPSGCSITRNAPFSMTSPISRTGIGGTMASTPVILPIPHIASMCLNPAGTKQQDSAPSPPRTPSHSRNVSGSSIRTAIRI
jgi:hypothetical protein